MHRSGLIHVRNFGRIHRRTLLQGAAAMGALAGTGLFPGRARAASEITFLGWQGYDEGLFADDTLQKLDATLNTTYIGNNDEIVTKLQSGGIGTIDIVTPYMGYIPLLAATGLIDPIDEALVPNLANVAEPFKSDPNIIVDGVRYGVPFTWGSGPMMYDPATIPTPPESWMDLFKPEYKGKVGMMDDPLGNIMLAATIVTDANPATMLTPQQLTESIDFMIKLKKEQVRLVAPSWGDLADALSRGEVVITYAGWETIKKFCADKGKVIEYTIPKEGTYAWLDNYCIAKDAPNREVDHAICNAIIGVPAQVKIGVDLIQGIVNSEAIAALPEASRAIYPYGDLAAFGQKARFNAFPPIDPDGTHATFTDWTQGWQRFQAA